MRGPVPADRLNPADPRRAWTAKDDSVSLPHWLGIPGLRHSIGLARWWHFGFDVLWLAQRRGVLRAAVQLRPVAPDRAAVLDVLPNAASTAIQYASLDFPANEGFVAYNGLQLIAYFLTVFVFAPVACVTGLMQAPAIAARFGAGRGAGQPADRPLAALRDPGVDGGVHRASTP